MLWCFPAWIVNSSFKSVLRFKIDNDVRIIDGWMQSSCLLSECPIKSIDKQAGVSKMLNIYVGLYEFDKNLALPKLKFSVERS
jgi:hypothetical protein